MKEYFSLFLIALFSHCIFAQYDGCDYQQTLTKDTKASVDVFSPGYPKNYTPSTRCRWSAVAPIGYKLRIICDVNMPKSPSCLEDVLLISLSGDSSFSDEYRYCGVGTFTVNSTDNKMTVGLRVSESSARGTFICKMHTIAPPPGSCTCGWKKQTRIVGGIEAEVNEFPMMAALIDLVIKNVRCGATIISVRWALTAAHCLMNQDLNSLALLVGDHNIRQANDTDASSLHLIEFFITHEKFNSSSMQNDIGLVKTSSIIKFNEKVGPACLPFKYAGMDFENYKVMALGWGMLEFGGMFPDTLQKVTLTVLPQNECNSAYPSRITRNQLCTYTAGKDACQSDSGGPLVWQAPDNRKIYNLGVISSGIGCATMNRPGINTKVINFLPWILENSSESFCAL